MNFPKHVAIIPDGNRRWAKKNKLASFLGHDTGSKVAENIINEAFTLKIPCFTFWGCSVSNIVKRPKNEVSFLFRIFETQFKKMLENKDIEKNKVKVNVFGRWKELFPQTTVQAIERVIKKTKNHHNYQLNFMLAYGGKEEMIEVIKIIVDTKGRNKDTVIDEGMVKNNLWTKDLPPVDLIIRTGEGDSMAHMSDGFMMWDASDAHLYFSKTLWPDFNKKEFKKAIDAFSAVEKRFGK